MTEQSGPASTAPLILEALNDSEPSWITLPRTAADVPALLRAAIDEFDAGERVAARAAAAWLKTKALHTYDTSRTRLLIAEHGVAGFYSLASAQVELRAKQRRALGLPTDVVTLPATLVTWIAKDAVRNRRDGSAAARGGHGAQSGGTAGLCSSRCRPFR
jgi:hypothetical protein